MTETSLSGRRALISGGCSGIGLATARALAGAKAQVTIADRADPPPLPDGVGHYRLDLRRGEQIDALWRYMNDNAALPDILISNAGIGLHERLDTGDPEKWGELLETNVLGALRLIRAFVPAMPSEGGDVVFVSSVAAAQAYPWGGPYSASKAALEMIAETLRLEALPGLRVTTVAPGVVDTAFFEHQLAGRQSVEEIGVGSLQPEQVADVILYALSRPPQMTISHVTLRPRGQAF